MRFDAVVLAGGAGSRLGGRDKPALLVGGRTLLDRAVEACADAGRIAVVGPRRATSRAVLWAREDPPGGGPVAALAAGLAALADPDRADRTGTGDPGSEASGTGTSGGRSPVTVLLAADLPFVTRDVTERLVDALAAATAPAREAGAPDGPDAVVLVDADGRDQTMLAAYRTSALRAAVAAVGDPHGAALRRVLAGLRVARLPDPGRAAFDCDTWPQVRAARATSGRMENVLEDWIEAVKAELGVELDVDVAALLDMTKVAAHNVVRPAAPLTAFLVGYAAAQAGGGTAAVADALRKAEALAAAYEAPAVETGGGSPGAPAGQPAAEPGAGRPRGDGAP